MLVLSRHKNEQIFVDLPGIPRIRVVVVEIRGDRVRIGIDAPPEAAVNRQEVADAIERQQRGKGTAEEFDEAVRRRLQKINDDAPVPFELQVERLSQRFGVSTAQVIERIRAIRGEKT